MSNIVKSLYISFNRYRGKTGCWFDMIIQASRICESEEEHRKLDKIY